MFVVPVAWLVVAVAVGIGKEPRSARGWTLVGLALHGLALAMAFWRASDPAAMLVSHPTALGLTGLFAGLWATLVLGGARDGGDRSGAAQGAASVMALAAAVATVAWVWPGQAQTGSVLKAGLPLLIGAVLLAAAGTGTTAAAGILAATTVRSADEDEEAAIRRGARLVVLCRASLVLVGAALLAGSIWRLHAWGSVWTWSFAETLTAAHWLFSVAALHALRTGSGSGRAAGPLMVAAAVLAVLAAAEGGALHPLPEVPGGS